MKAIVKLKTIVIFGAMALSAALAYGYASPHQNSYRVNAGQTVTIDEPDLCQKVTNSGSKDIFIPTATANEWSAFRANKPADITLSSCAGGSYHQTVRENQTASLSCPSGTISSWSSVYGANTPCGGRPCGSCAYGATSCTVTYNNTNCGDHCYGYEKNGDLDITCSASGGARTVCCSAEEDSSCTVTCPSGVITQIKYVKYGASDGCGNESSCDSAAGSNCSRSPTSCIGRSSCSWNFNNGRCGDTCYGWVKTGYLTVVCQ